MDTNTVVTSIDAITLEVADPDATAAFHQAAFGPDLPVRTRAAQEATSGFRGFTLNLLTSQPGNVDAFAEAALAHGATVIKPVSKGFWGYGGVLRAPDGTIWKIASSSKKDTGPAGRRVDQVVLLLGCTDVAVSRTFYVEHGLTVAKSFGRNYVEFDTGTSAVKLALLGRKALAKDAGVPIDGTGSHRLTINPGAGTFTDPDGFVWAS